MRLVTAALALLVAASALASVAGAEPETHKLVQFGLGAGFNVPNGPSADSVKTGFHVEGLVIVTPPGLPLSFRGTLSLARFGAQRDGLGAGTVLGGVGDVRYALPLPGPVKPYVMAGIGAFNVTALSDPAVAASSETRLGLDAGVGVTIHFASVDGFVETKVHNIYTDKGFTGLDHVAYFPVTVGILF